MTEVEAHRARTNLSRLLERVEGEERITPTRHGRPVAMLVPVEEKRPPEEVVGESREFHRGRRLVETGSRALIEEGRRL